MASDPDQPLLTAANLLAHRRARGLVPADLTAPETVLLCFSREVMNDVMRWKSVKKLPGFYGDVMMLKRAGERVAVAGNFGLGGPVTAVLAEDLAALGARHFIIIGMAGGLQPHLQAGDLVVVDRALRDDGVSRHYLPPAPDVAASPELVAELSRALDQHNLPHHLGTTWTMDAPYRETRRAALRHQQAGVMTVEMEAAALLAVGQALGVQTGAVLVIADTLADGRWRLDVNLRAVNHMLTHVLKVLVDYLSSR